MDSLDLHMLDQIGEKVKEPAVCDASPSLALTKENQNDSVRSSAVVTYSAAKYPALFSQLAPFTNLNLAPSNWLRNAPGLRPSFLLSGSRPSVSNASDKLIFSSFQMAGSHLNLVGDIDVVSDAENLKKLLKVPYSKAHVSMAVHRIGNTLLLEHFDINHDSLKSHEWKWFKEIYKQLTRKGMLKKKLPSAQHERLMLSKFLYYSVHSGQNNSGSNSEDLKVEGSLRIKEVPQNKEHIKLSSSDSAKTLPVVEETMATPTPENSLIPAELRWKYWTPDDAGTSQCFDMRHTFERTIFWTFEDLQMLLGANMPIFGGGEYPAVSLRLLDSNKPINILTGIDYWLDNLICNVPEVVMCFHVNGIVQKYEVIKTEEIPKITAPKFNPQVIKDIAQNILSFLKSNCTKEGHTYWLFKGSNDDVVKLYDLTSLCNNQVSKQGQNNDIQNPFVISVATLMYKMAVSLMKQQKASSTEQNSTIKQLLHKCVQLLEKQDKLAPVMLDAALCMLSTLYLPDVIDEVELEPLSPLKMRLHSNSITEKADTNGAGSIVLDNAEVAMISSVNDLSIPEKFKSDLSATNAVTQAKEETDSYSLALSYIIKGLKIFNRFDCIDKNSQIENRKELMFVHMQMIRNTTLIYYGLAKHAYSSQCYGKSLQCIKVALLSYEYLEQLIDVQFLQAPSELERSQSSNDYDIAAVLQSTTPPEYNLLLSRLLSLGGDIQMLQCQWGLEEKLSFKQEFEKYCRSDSAINRALEKNFTGVGKKYEDAINLSTQYYEILASCRVCFETALDKLSFNNLITTKSKRRGNQKGKDGSKKSKESNKLQGNGVILQISLKRKLGHVCNEQGALHLDSAVEMLNQENCHADDEKQALKLSFSCFETALKCFSDVTDNTNQALVLSNLGRLMRVCAQSTAQNQDELFTHQEQQLYDNAIEYYKKAIALQKQNSKNRKGSNPASAEKHVPSIADNLSWQLGGAYFTMAQRLQDHPPLTLKPLNEIEKMVLDLLNKSLKCCSDIWKKTEKRPQALYHCAKIHARIASLYHNSCREIDDFNKKRQFRGLAEVQYEKSCTIFNELADTYMREYLRVTLEWLALKEQRLPSTLNQTAKIKLIQEGFTVLASCLRPLNVLMSCLQGHIDSGQTSESSPVDPQKHSEAFNIDNFKEWHALTDVLSTICKSLLLSVVKITSPPANASTKKKSQSQLKLPHDHSYYKQIYSKTLRLIQKTEALSVVDMSVSCSVNLMKKAEALLEVIRDVK